MHLFIIDQKELQLINCSDEEGVWSAGPSMLQKRAYFTLNSVGDTLGKTQLHCTVLQKHSQKWMMMAEGQFTAIFRFCLLVNNNIIILQFPKEIYLSSICMQLSGYKVNWKKGNFTVVMLIFLQPLYTGNLAEVGNHPQSFLRSCASTLFIMFAY